MPPRRPCGRRSAREVERLGCTTVVVEHHLEPWLDFADRLVVLDASGRIVADGPVLEVLAADGPALAEQGVWVPGLPDPEPVAVDPDLVGPWSTGPEQLVAAEQVRVELRARLGGQRRPPTVAVDGVDANLAAGQTLAVTGPSGAGKSTLVATLAGLVRPTSGRVVSHPELATRKGAEPWRWSGADLAARLSWVPQVPEHGVVTKTVIDEVLAAGRATGRDTARLRARAEGLLDLFGLSQLTTSSPYHLSGGEQRRLMVAAALAHGPFAVLLDEPTVGQDRATWAAVVGAVTAARRAGAGAAVSTHDRRAVSAVADDEIALDSGRAR